MRKIDADAAKAMYPDCRGFCEKIDSVPTVYEPEAEDGEQALRDKIDELEEEEILLMMSRCAQPIYEGQRLAMEQLRDEVEELRNRVYNLTLYLADATDAPLIGKMVIRRVIHRHPGLPGFNPEILEERKCAHG